VTEYTFESSIVICKWANYGVRHLYLRAQHKLVQKPS